jgi:hypothetical protein
VVITYAFEVVISDKVWHIGVFLPFKGFKSTCVSISEYLKHVSINFKKGILPNYILLSWNQINLFFRIATDSIFLLFYLILFLRNFLNIIFLFFLNCVLDNTDLFNFILIFLLMCILVSKFISGKVLFQFSPCCRGIFLGKFDKFVLTLSSTLNEVVVTVPSNASSENHVLLLQSNSLGVDTA